jgi:hypothetical protein
LDVLQIVVTTIIYIPHQSEICADCFFHSYIKYNDKKTESKNSGFKKQFLSAGKN